MDGIREISDRFELSGSFVEGEAIEAGLINTTYRVTYDDGGRKSRYLLQRINEEVFPDPEAVMANISKVTRHIDQKLRGEGGDFAGQTLGLYPAFDGREFVEGAKGGVWRCYNFIEGCRTYEVIENTQQAYEVAKAFGAFQGLVSDLGHEELAVTIAGFHDTPARYERLLEAIENDVKGRVALVEDEISFMREREEDVGRLVADAAAGNLPERVIHNDTKLNNVMMDEETDEAVCVIDLDTVMPGLTAYDFGDLVRSATSPAAEDERDLSLVEMRLPMFEALVKGYLEAAGGFLTSKEVEVLPFAGKLIALETGIRFLTDFLEGDHYFKVTREGQNLDRCRTQLALVRSIEAQEAEMTAVVEKWSRR